MKKVIAVKSEERDILKSLEKDEWIPDFNRRIKKKYADYAKATIKKRHFPSRSSD